MEGLSRRKLLAVTGLAASASARANEGAYFAGLIAAMRVEWPRNETIHIVCHGHSVPAGYFKTPAVQPFDSYPHLFHRGLKDQFPHAVINVIVTAKGGEDSVDGAARFDREVLAIRPRLVVIDYGLNDRGPGLANARVAWTSMMRKCLDRGIQLMLLTPTGDSRVNILDPAISLARHAEQIRGLAGEFQVPLVDSFKIYQDHVKNGGRIEDLLSQVNHPNRRGHELVAGAMLQYFRG